MRSILILPDLQIPFHDPGFIKVMEKFIKDFAPDEVGQIGDFLDQPEPSRWNKGMAGEYEPTLQKSINSGKEIIERLTIEWIKLGNHDERIETYVARYAPALGALDALRYENLLELDALGVVYHRKPFRIAPGWLAAHGHEGSLSPVSGRTAFNLASQFDQSVICGHTHRAGVVSRTIGYRGSTRTIHGLEIGHAMDTTKANYIKGTANWQKAFGLMFVEGKTVQATYVSVKNDNSFIWDRHLWKA